MSQAVLIEVCVDSVASAVAAERGGAQRLEVCSDLLEGGVTPSGGLLEVVRAKISIAMHAIIRPRAGDFCYSDEEFDVMCRDIDNAKRVGIEGVVLGILDPEGRVDIQRTRQLVKIARPMSITFHRAFDMSADLQQSLEDVCAAGADRILTSGGEQSCIEGVQTLAQLVKSARGRVIIMAGGGIGPDNVAKIVENTSVSEIHVGLASPMTSLMKYRNPRVILGKAPGREYDRRQVLEENVRSLARAIAEREQTGVRARLSHAALNQKNATDRKT